MNLYEYQGQKILSQFGIKYPFSIIVNSSEEAIIAAKKIFENTVNNSWVIKAQITYGGRGKCGGINNSQLVKEIFNKSYKFIGLFLITNQTSILGKLVYNIIISSNIKKTNQEYYISFIINRTNEKNIMMYSNAGGVFIEEVENNKIFIEEINPIIGLQLFKIRKMSFKLDIFDLKQLLYFMSNLYHLYIYYYVYLIEINPFITTYNHFFAVDIKIILDSLYRKPINYIKLDGTLGCIVNGAGLSMCTIDIVKKYGVCPANFLDLSVTADTNMMINACNMFIKNKIMAILINIFGGIVRCDKISKCIVYAYTKKKYLIPPIILRLEGTKSAKSTIMIEQSKLNIYSLITLKESAKIIKYIRYEK